MKLCPRSSLKRALQRLPPVCSGTCGRANGSPLLPPGNREREMGSLGCAVCPVSRTPGAEAGAGDKAGLSPSLTQQKEGLCW